MNPDQQLHALDANPATIAAVGGKAYVLSLLAAAGLPVPAGFVIPAAACAALLKDARDIQSLKDAIVERYRSLGDDSLVAVRSSATYEDGAEHSAAGQHDSVLDVQGEHALFAAITRCAASAWSDRAATYRARFDIPEAQLGMAIVVQRMVPARISGVLFTAHPLTGDRNVWVLNADTGTGDALVAGEVSADTFLLDPAQLDHALHPLLNREQQAQLIALGRSVLALFGNRPQDIEWAFDEQRCWLLQSRAITQLPMAAEPVQWLPPAGMQRLVRRQVVENMPGPLSALFEDLYLSGLEDGIATSAQDMVLPIAVNDVMQLPMFVTVNGYGYSRYDLKFGWPLLWRIPSLLWWSLRHLPGFMRELIPHWRDIGLPNYQSTVARWRALDPQTLTAPQLLAGIRELTVADARYWFDISMMVGAAKVTEGWLVRVLGKRAMATSDQLLRGFASPTLDAQASLQALADRIAEESQGSGILAQGFEAFELGRLVALSPALAAAIDEHRETFGHQVYSLDFVEPTQGESDLVLRHGLWRGLQKPTPAPGLSASSESAEQLAQQTAASMGTVRGWLFRKALNMAMRYAPQREQALFYMGYGWPVLRRLASALGQRLVASQQLQQPDDVYHLRAAELQQAVYAQAEAGDMAERAQQRRRLRASRAHLHPPARVPENLRLRLGPFDLTRFFEVWETQKHNAPDSMELQGYPVSAGVVIGVACVVHSPVDLPSIPDGSILVCPTTTPAWTPLFDHAAGLVTDVGGLLAHGSIVAREYGIPAVLGTGNGTARIETGQLLRVDGSNGTVTLLSG